MDDLKDHIEVEKDLPYLNRFMRDGVFLFKKIFDIETLKIIENEVNTIKNTVTKKIESMDRPIRKYSDIVERELGRLDYRCGFVSTIFDVIAQPIINLTKVISPCIDFRYYWGAIPSQSGAGPTPMHRDIYSLLNTTKGENLDQLDILIPPYYLTVLIPLVPITQENGPTQFIKGSHKKMIVNECDETLYTPLPSPGDVLIFDGRILHKGLANQTDSERMVAYMTFIANWYHDQTFAIDDYLFPALSKKEY